MPLVGITACQVDAVFAVRTSRASLREIRVFRNKLLVWEILFELVLATTVIYLPPLQAIFGTNALSLREHAILTLFSFLT